MSWKKGEVEVEFLDYSSLLASSLPLLVSPTPSSSTPTSSTSEASIVAELDDYLKRQSIAMRCIEHMSAARDRYLAALNTVHSSLEDHRLVIEELEAVERRDGGIIRTAYRMLKATCDSVALVETSVKELLPEVKQNYAMILRVGAEYERRFEANATTSNQLAAAYHLKAGYFGPELLLTRGSRCRTMISNRQFDPKYICFFTEFFKKSLSSSSESSFNSSSSPSS